MPVQVITESDTGLIGPIADQFGVRTIAHYLNYGGKTHSDFSIDRDEFITVVRDGTEVSSAHPTVQDMTAAFTTAGKDGDPVLYIPITSRTSKSYELALSVRERLPQLRIEVFDSRRVVGGHAMVAIAAARLAHAGSSIDEIIDRLEKLDPRIDETLVFDSLRQLAHEGRIDTATDALGTILTVKPLIAYRSGVATLIGKARTNQQALDAIVSQIKTALARFDADTISFLVEYGTTEQWADEIISRLTAEFSSNIAAKIPVAPSTLLRIGAGGWTVAWMVEG